MINDGMVDRRVWVLVGMPMADEDPLVVPSSAFEDDISVVVAARLLVVSGELGTTLLLSEVDCCLCRRARSCRSNCST